MAASVITARAEAGWWRLAVAATAGRRPLPVSELGEPLVRHLVDAVLRGWLDAADPAVAVIYLPAG